MNHSPYPASVEKQVSLLQLQIVEKIHERTTTSFTCPSPSHCPLSRRRSRAQETRDHVSPPCHTRFWSARGAGHTPRAVIGTDLLLSSTQQDKKLWERLIWWWCRLSAISSDSKGCTTVCSVTLRLFLIPLKQVRVLLLPPKQGAILYRERLVPLSF